MKLRYTILLSTGVVWAAFIAISGVLLKSFIPNKYLIYYFACGVAAFGLMYILLRLHFMRRLERLTHDVLQHKLEKHVVISGDDEVAQVASHVNRMLDIIQTSEETFARRWQDRVTDLEDQSKLSLLPKSHYDSLTTLPNRIFFNEMLNKTLSHAARHNKVLAILLIDLDKFKNINDAFGMKAGNEVLKEIAQRFSNALRNGDLIARSAGDEFIVLLYDIGAPKFASSVAEKLLHACSKPVVVDEHSFYLRASIGIGIFPDDGVTLEELQKKADLALYKAKQAGGGIYQYFTSKMTLEANKHVKLETALHNALRNEEFTLYYQPKTDIASGIITGVEALIRWINPEIGIINPEEFIHQAEENGLILPVGAWVLRTAAYAHKSWIDQGLMPVSMAVNLSPQQFMQHDIVKQVSDILGETKMDPAYLELEITELTVMTDVNLAFEKLTKLKELGIKICIDDFGTGYTSISYLKKFPIDILKIDQSFIKGMPQNKNDLAITGAIIALGHNLGMEITAEGVETADQLQVLMEFKCDLVQGYYFSRPLPEQKMVLLLEKNK